MLLALYAESNKEAGDYRMATARGLKKGGPMPHPFCTCLWYVDTDKTLDEIGRELRAWEDGESNERLDKAFGEWKKKYTSAPESDIIRLDDIPVFRSVGARHEDQLSIVEPDAEESVSLVNGTYIQNVTVFAGKGTKTPIRDAELLEEYYGIPAEEWQKVKGIAHVLYRGEEHLAEIHWYQAEGVGRIEAKVKAQSPWRYWLDDR